MSNGIAFPVHRTADPVEAMRTARSLVALADRRFAYVDIDAVLPTLADVLRLRAALPDAWFQPEDYGAWNDGAWNAAASSDEPPPPGGLPGRELPADPAVLARHVPLRLQLEDQPLDSAEDTFRRLVDGCPGWLQWCGLGWPAVPDQDLHATYDQAGVSILFNSATEDLDEPADRHTVLLHVRRVRPEGYELRQATWLAAQAGLTVVGEPR